MWYGVVFAKIPHWGLKYVFACEFLIRMNNIHEKDFTTLITISLHTLYYSNWLRQQIYVCVSLHNWLVTQSSLFPSTPFYLMSNQHGEYDTIQALLKIVRSLWFHWYIHPLQSKFRISSAEINNICSEAAIKRYFVMAWWLIKDFVIHYNRQSRFLSIIFEHSNWSLGLSLLLTYLWSDDIPPRDMVVMWLHDNIIPYLYPKSLNLLQ